MTTGRSRRFPPLLRYFVPALMLGLAIATLWISSVLETRVARRRVEEETARRLRVLAAVLSDDIENAVRHGQPARLWSSVATARSDPDVTLAVPVDGTNQVVASSDYMLRSATVDKTPIASLAGAMDMARVKHAAVPARLSSSQIALIVPVSLSGPMDAAPSSRGLLVLASDTTQLVAETAASAQLRAAVATDLVVVLSLGAWVLFKKMLLFRVNHLAAAAQRVGAGDFTANFELGGTDELALLSTELTRMNSQLRAHADEVRGSRLALEASHERFAAVAKATNDIIWDWDPRTDRVWRNEAVKTVLGYEAIETTQGLSWLRNVASGDHERLEASFRTALASGASTWSSEYQLRRADGSLAHIFDRAIIVRDESGLPVRMVGAMTDITAQRRAEEGRQRLAAILEASPDFVGTADANTFQVTWINRAGRRMLGLTDEEDISHLRVQDIQPAWVVASLLDEMFSVASRGGVWSGEAALLKRDGQEVPVLQAVVAHARADGHVEYLSTVARDIRDRKQLEAQLLQSQKMESIGRLAGGVAHDFNNMLTAIIGYTELAKSHLPEEHPAQHDLTNVYDAAQRSAALTRQLLAFARKQVISPRPIDLNDLDRAHGIDAQSAAGRDRSASSPASAEPLPGSDRPRTIRAGPDEPGRQCPRRHAWRRRPAHRNHRVIPRRCLVSAASGKQTRSIWPGARERQRRGHDARRDGSLVRAILHDQAERGRYRPWTGDVLRHHPAERRKHRRLQRARQGHDIRHLCAATRRTGRTATKRRGFNAARRQRQRNDPARRRRIIRPRAGRTAR